jgi:soluble lytic murein transglycosylase-like protein
MQQLILLLHFMLPILPVTPAPEPFEHHAFRLTQTDLYDPLILDSSRAWGLDPFLFKGLLFAESGFQTKKINPRGAAGIAQLTPGGRYGVRTVRCLRGECRVFTLQDALNPQKAIPAAAELLAYMKRICGPDRMLGMYNTGRCGPWRRVFVNQVYRHINRFRVFGGLPPTSPPTPSPQRLLARQLPTS